MGLYMFNNVAMTVIAMQPNTDEKRFDRGQNT
jgi:hypothetical protein